MARKQTSALVSTIAARLMTEDPLAPSDPLRQAIKDCGLPLCDRAADALLDRLGAVLAPFLADVRTVSASALGQDEIPADEA